MTTCNETVMRVFTQMDSHLYNKVQLGSTSLSYVVNMLLSAPLLLVITRPPSLLSKLRFLLLIHLLFCDNLQLLLKTVMTVMFISRSGILVSQCLIFTASSQACSMVQVLLTAALAADRCVAIKWPLRYELLFSPCRKQTLVAVTWGGVRAAVLHRALYGALPNGARRWAAAMPPPGGGPVPGRKLAPAGVLRDGQRPGAAGLLPDHAGQLSAAVPRHPRPPLLPPRGGHPGLAGRPDAVLLRACGADQLPAAQHPAVRHLGNRRL